MKTKLLFVAVLFVLFDNDESWAQHQNIQTVQPDSISTIKGEEYIYLPGGNYKFIRVGENQNVVITGSLDLDPNAHSGVIYQYGNPVISDSTIEQINYDFSTSSTIILEHNGHLEVYGGMHQNLSGNLNMILKDDSEVICNSLFNINLQRRTTANIMSFGTNAQIVTMGTSDLKLRPFRLTDAVNGMTPSQLEALIDISKFLFSQYGDRVRNNFDRGVDIYFGTHGQNPQFYHESINPIAGENGNPISKVVLKDLLRVLLQSNIEQIHLEQRGSSTPFSVFFATMQHEFAQLPVELVNFEVVKNGDDSFDAIWSTATEINSDYFKLDYSNDKIHYFEIAGHIPAKGNSNTLEKYKVENLPISSNNVYVRLTQYDFDGSFQSWTSKVHSSNLALNYNKLYPIPTNDNLHVQLQNAHKEGVIVELIEASTGKVVFKKKYGEVQSIDINTSSFNDGVYILHAKCGVRNRHDEILIFH
ncbi:T9SS type A sorting domain-containing protein [Flammeovirga yaeyamensis]|uniref:T9SS type A sorting domain-containing protein n=1 Tax=Flammeovirga yaeyamensis TaxID=367791 RepID=A0AAX1N4C2_9BACT|nr:T9SS type A sorting domain-containing protein [Flammeovirga yaeyamensis]MBB3701458.1 hypothetical protein [Flammeovirga yaeyamensis]NMF38510.1 hypothetical protein [Flammeovirga yaeyamensis]QWG02409.1 T9SS type A sorting domain-containing protein [Flammeovirga yaeyamensis]